MPRLLILVPSEVSRDPRARRQALAAQELGFGVVAACGRLSGEQREPLDGVTVIRVGRPARVNRQWLRGTASAAQAAPKRELRGLYRLARLAVRTAQLVRGARSFGGVDVVHANDFDTLPAGYVLARELGARLVYDAHEVYSSFEPDPPRIATALALRLERALARRADAVVTVSEPVAGELARRLGVHPLVVINAPDVPGAEPAPVPAPPPLLAIYQGAFGTGRALDDLLEALQAAPSTQLTLRASTASRALIERTLPEDVAARVVVRDPVPPDGVLEGLRGHHVGLIFDRPLTRNAELSSPNKLFEYLAAGLAVVGPRLEGLAFVEDEELGVLFEPGSPHAMARALERLAADPPALERLRSNALRAARERYNAQTQRTTLRAAWGGDRRDGGANGST